jgi:hypothetical protein
MLLIGSDVEEFGLLFMEFGTVSRGDLCQAILESLFALSSRVKMSIGLYDP